MKKDSLELQVIVFGWLAWQSVMLISLLSRVSVLEDRQGIHSHAKAEPQHKSDIWASPELIPIPNLLPEKK